MTILSWVSGHINNSMISLETGLRSGDRHGFTPFLSDSTRSVWDKISQLLQQSTHQWPEIRLKRNELTIDELFLKFAKSGKPKHSLLWTTLVPPISDCWRSSPGKRMTITSRLSNKDGHCPCHNVKPFYPRLLKFLVFCYQVIISPQSSRDTRQCSFQLVLELKSRLESNKYHIWWGDLVSRSL